MVKEDIMAKQKLNVDTSIVDYLKSIGKDSSYQARKKLAQELNISNYKGTAKQNISMLNTLKSGAKKTTTTPKVPKAVQPTVKPTVKTPVSQPVAKPVQPAIKPIQPVIKPIQPVAKPAQPVIQAPVEQKAEIQSTNINQQAPAPYESPYSAQIDSILNNIINRQPFNYNVNADPIYKQYNDAYTQSGNLAMRDAMGNVAALTGGYGNTYGQTVGQQVYNQHMGQLNNVIPELYQAAYGRYQNEGNNLLNNLSALQGLEQQAYGQYRDTIGDYQSDRAFDYNKSQDALAQQNLDRQFEYGVSQDTLAQENWNRQFEHGVSQDTLVQQNWEKSFDYGVSQDTLAQENWKKSFDYDKQMDDRAQQNYLSDRSYNRSQDAIDQKNYLKEFAYRQSQDAQSQSNLDRQFKYGKQQDRADRQDALDKYYLEQVQKSSKEQASATTKRVEDAMDRAEKMLKETDILGNPKYEPREVFDYLLGLDLTDEEIATIANTVYELRVYMGG